MIFSNISLAIVLVSGIIMANICLASSLSNRTLQYLTPTNAARAEVSLPPLVWNKTLAAFARSYAKKRAVDCKLQHSESPIYGENIAMSPGSITPVKAVDFWVSEKLNYDYGSNTCKDSCGHYTQIIWKATKSVGCAREKCQNEGTFITCNYYPPGNVVGEKPY
ncbi:pathogenesis-related protein PR-1 type-like [Spinacia oleracea]|uniref:Pathogenesis-related protein PR-1 type-like n=1 Tax=Spinacia oleracea TaxID=3562 RepID=A0ABM3RNI9_SPIOL|nr:pathogenesis-related protein PR-1 type-like [Spinacia oleracea]